MLCLPFVQMAEPVASPDLAMQATTSSVQEVAWMSVVRMLILMILCRKSQQAHHCQRLPTATLAKAQQNQQQHQQIKHNNNNSIRA